jgi:hypothetical protein
MPMVPALSVVGSKRHVVNAKSPPINAAMFETRREAPGLGHANGIGKVQLREM